MQPLAPVRPPQPRTTHWQIPGEPFSDHRTGAQRNQETASHFHSPFRWVADLSVRHMVPVDYDILPDYTPIAFAQLSRKGEGDGQFHLLRVGE